MTLKLGFITLLLLKTIAKRYILSSTGIPSKDNPS
jgi:hypothetical protein